MIKVGITGGIGSGKSIVSKAFSMLGVPTYNADNRAKSIIHENTQVKAAIIDLLGEEAYTEDVTYNRTFVAELVFSDAGLLKKLNNIVHPAVRNDVIKWFYENVDRQCVVYEAAIMNAAKSGNDLDYVVVVYADIETRVSRILKRDAYRTTDQVKGIIKNQKSDEEFIELADFVVHNNEGDLVLEQVLKLYSQFITL
ncbi:MAG: dephospho-CoA kinase [Spirosomataceae bacterium]|jgi:dephospho-CoA kinase